MRVIRLIAAVLALSLTAACGDFGPTGPESASPATSSWCRPQGGFLGGGC